MDKGKFIDLRVLSQDTGFNTLARTLSNGANVLSRELLEAWKKKWSTPSEPEMAELQWQMVEREMKRLRVDTYVTGYYGIVQKIHHLLKQ